MKKIITFGLSVSEVKKAQNEIRKYKDDLINKTRSFAEQLAEKGIYIAKMNLTSHGAIDTSELISSITKEHSGDSKDGSTWIVYTDCPYAPYIEFGFGIVGQASPHPDTSIVGWKYDINSHGESGWHYEGRDGKWHFSKGQPSKPFMYETANDLKEVIPEVAREVFGS